MRSYIWHRLLILIALFIVITHTTSSSLHVIHGTCIRYRIFARTSWWVWIWRNLYLDLGSSVLKITKNKTNLKVWKQADSHNRSWMKKQAGANFWGGKYIVWNLTSWKIKIANHLRWKTSQVDADCGWPKGWDDFF